ncbi:SGNH/GDSL hydrolase family protein [Humibacter sp.]|uniref:SGNH/GDSL hydrolase family protein n=1 Tax=Humibacter sp. TaxID=1940291 RepID=UPI003F809663
MSTTGYGIMWRVGRIIALGDSIINADESWGHWLSLATGWELTRRSVGGATSRHVLDQLDVLNGRYDLGLLTVGTNDVLFDWHPEQFAGNLSRIIGALDDVCDRVIVQTLPLGLAHFPLSGSGVRRRVEHANRLIRDAGSGHGAIVVDGSALHGRRLLSVDRVHPTVEGQLVLADAAAQQLGIGTRPSALDCGFRSFSPTRYAGETTVRTVRALVKRVIRYQPPEVRY